MAKLSDCNDDHLASELRELRNRVNTLEKQNLALLSVNQTEVEPTSHTPTLETVQEEIEDWTLPSFRQEASQEVEKNTKNDGTISCSALARQLLQQTKDETKAALRQVAALAMKMRCGKLGKLAPKRLVRDYKVKQLRKQWRKEINEGQLTMPVVNNEPITTQDEDRDPDEGERLKKLRSTPLAAASKLPVGREGEEAEEKDQEDVSDEDDVSHAEPRVSEQHSPGTTIPQPIPTTATFSILNQNCTRSS